MNIFGGWIRNKSYSIDSVMSLTHRGCVDCPEVNLRCQACVDRIHAMALSQGPERGRRPPLIVPTIPSSKRVVRKGREWVVCCDIYVGYEGGSAPGSKWLKIPQSKWYNSFKTLAEYEQHIRSSKLWDELGELSGMDLGYEKGTDISYIEVLRSLFAEKFHLV